MCTSLATIALVVQTRVNANEMFTAFDISLAVQEQARQQNDPVERHRDMKHDIHQEMDKYVSSGVYIKTLRSVGADTPAFVYHPVGSDASQYQPMQRNSGSSNQPTSAPAPVSANPSVAATLAASNGSNDFTNRLPDGRSTLTVPADLLRQVGFNPSDLAYLWVDTDNKGNSILCVGKTLPSGVSQHCTYTVDHGCNVRVTYPQRASANIKAPSFDFTVEGSKVVIAAHA